MDWGCWLRALDFASTFEDYPESGPPLHLKSLLPSKYMLFRLLKHRQRHPWFLTSKYTNASPSVAFGANAMKLAIFASEGCMICSVKYPVVRYEGEEGTDWCEVFVIFIAQLM